MLRTLILVALLPFAAYAVEVNYLGPLDQWPEIDPTTSAAGVIGRTGQPGGFVDPGHIGPLFTATTIDPRDYDLPCEIGIVVRAIHLVVAVVIDDGWPFLPAPLLGDGYLRSQYPPEAGCFVPTSIRNFHYGGYCFDTASYTVIEGPTGFYELVYTDFGSDCGCIDLDYTQALCVRTADPTTIRYVTDLAPGHCPDHNAEPYMQGIAHWVPFEAPGNLAIWAEVDCCEVPVATDPTSWSTLKRMFR